MWNKLKQLKNGFARSSQIQKTLHERETEESEEINKIKLRNREALVEDILETHKRCPIEVLEKIRKEQGKSIYENIPSNKEIRRAINHFANCKTTRGEDGIDTAEYKLITMLTDRGKEMLECLYKQCWETEDTPKAWKISKLILLDKPGKKGLRPISLTSCMGKIYEKLIKDRLETWAEENGIIQEYQNGFRRGRSAQDNVYSLITKIK